MHWFDGNKILLTYLISLRPGLFNETPLHLLIGLLICLLICLLLKLVIDCLFIPESNLSNNIAAELPEFVIDTKAVRITVSFSRYSLSAVSRAQQMNQETDWWIRVTHLREFPAHLIIQLLLVATNTMKRNLTTS